MVNPHSRIQTLFLDDTHLGMTQSTGLASERAPLHTHRTPLTRPSASRFPHTHTSAEGGGGALQKKSSYYLTEILEYGILFPN